MGLNNADFFGGLTPRLTGAGARSAQGTNTGHENGEAMASIGVRVERPVRLGREGKSVDLLTHHTFKINSSNRMPLLLELV